MTMQNGTMTFNEAKVQYLEKARKLRESLEPEQNRPDLYVQDQIGEMALILMRLYKKENGKQLPEMTDLEEMKLYQQILAELDGEAEPDFLKAK